MGSGFWVIEVGFVYEGMCFKIVYWWDDLGCIVEYEKVIGEGDYNWRGDSLEGCVE